MNRKFLSFGLVAAMLTTSVSFNALADKEDTGAIVGAIVGGILGNQVGKGNGKTVATGLGIILGAVVGADIGKQLDENDRRALAEAQRDAFLRPIGERTEWDGYRYGSRTGARGNFRTTREGYLRTNSREICREYESVIVTRRKTETKTGIACSRADGSWREVNSSEVVFRDGTVIRNETSTSGRGSNYGGGYNRPQPVRPIEPSYPRPRPGSGYGYGYGNGGSIQEREATVAAIRNFVWSTNGLNKSSSEADRIARLWIERNCEGAYQVQAMANQFKQEYDFAWSTRGLNMSSFQARQYALDRVSRMSRCSNLLY